MRSSQLIGMFNRRRFLAGAGVALGIPTGIHAQSADPSPTPIPIRIQTPDLAFADALKGSLVRWSDANAIDDLRLSIVPAEPASDSLLNDARKGIERFSGAFVPNWTIPDLVRDHFILPAPPTLAPLPLAIAQLRSFGGGWFATDLDHDCDLLYFRQDQLDSAAFEPAETWNRLLEQAEEFGDLGMGGVGIPTTHAQQVVDHFTAMAASVVLGSDPPSPFWFEPDSMAPAIASADHQR
ncbi:MAG TPA: hypothetical protein VFP05_01485, partial [Thermomicrobiales bacterium]|nr:hypothetical protein [Thermomicrobiales bacterium]